MAQRMRCILRNQARRSLPWAEKGRDRRFCAFGTKGAFLNSQRKIAFLEIGAPQPGEAILKGKLGSLETQRATAWALEREAPSLVVEQTRLVARMLG